MRIFARLIVLFSIFAGSAQEAISDTLDTLGAPSNQNMKKFEDPAQGGNGFGIREPEPQPKSPLEDAKQFEKPASTPNSSYTKPAAITPDPDPFGQDAFARQQKAKADAEAEAQQKASLNATIDAKRTQAEDEYRSALYSKCLSTYPSSACASAYPNEAKRATETRPNNAKNAPAGAPSSNKPVTPSNASQYPPQQARAPKPDQKPLPNSQSPIPDYSRPMRSTSTGFQAQPSPARAVGGISLSKAAAERMPLDISFDASSLAGQTLVIAGRSATTGIDAALLLTAFRAACDQHDPYFSLDPDDGVLWGDQGREAARIFWDKVKKDFDLGPVSRSARKGTQGLDIRTVSAARDYQQIWREISPRFPNFRSKLVFQPEWLRETRFGEIMYKADVLLKELSSGVSVLTPGKLRAAAVKGYLSSDTEFVAKQLLAAPGAQTVSQPAWRSSRLWFDIAPSAAPERNLVEPAPPSAENSQLKTILVARGLLREREAGPLNAAVITRHGNTFDLSRVTPRMFVRLHDHATRQDLSDHDPVLDGIARDVSNRFDEYAAAYEELATLRDMFRAYVIAVKSTADDQRFCDRIGAMPLLAAEKVDNALPAFHRSELFLTVANQWSISGNTRQSVQARSSSMNGGVSIRGRDFADNSTFDGETVLTRTVNQAIVEDRLELQDSDHKYLTLVLDGALAPPVRMASHTSGSSVDVAGGIENEPPAAVLPSRQRQAAVPSASRPAPGEDTVENAPPAATMPATKRHRELISIGVLALLIGMFMLNRRFRTGRAAGGRR